MKNAVLDEEELSSTRNVDRLLPSQPYNSKMYIGEDFYGSMESMLLSMHPQSQFDIETKPGITYAALGSEINTLRFYQFLIRSHGFGKILELGTYIGVSAMYMADAGAHVYSVEKGEEFFQIALNNVRDNNLQDQITLICADAKGFMNSCADSFDFILIDCAKESYRELLELSLARLAPNGLILVDDVFFQGDTLNAEPASEKGRGVRAALDYALTLADWEKIILPIGNGLLLMRRK